MQHEAREIDLRILVEIHFSDAPGTVGQVGRDQPVCLGRCDDEV